MKQLPSSLSAHLAGGITTLARCWIVSRADGEAIGFTDHDRALTVAGTVCLPQNGLEPSADQSGPGFAVGGGEISGALSATALSEEDLEAGLWDGAEIAAYVVNWQDPEQAVLLRRARIGEVTRAAGAFTAEARGLSHLLEIERGRVLTRACDADVGDARCGINLDDPAYSASGTILAGSEPAKVMVDGLEGFGAGWFTGGRLSVAAGDHTGFACEVASHEVIEGTVILHLWQATPRPLSEGVEVRVSVGCDRRFATCAAKFANTDRFRGFPHMPGTDFVLSYPSRNNSENDGSALVT